MSLLLQSAPAPHSVLASFCYKPFDAKVDWSLVAKASPCYMTVRALSLTKFCLSSSNLKIMWLIGCRLQYLKDSIDGIVNFFESSTAVSQTIALETAAAVQVCLIFAMV